ncbi:MAG: YjjG family noncanonical pyrimidine nucleotidase [Bacteroidota bacterium]|nr:YjjG family noncanonical pyrimidine nucleotidase [Bacteroidota bacterium]MDP4212797.1 YjjG family noncanonical pyrimidine nucleotidase [Bacteroidota bacterium]MDP4250227.1 YjjG family noncanonical pyrimidine nucleotidase [Bacteroidota bacterium]
MRYKHLFFDLDHTLWDFDSNSREALQDIYTSLSLKEAGVDDFGIFHSNYLAHNNRLWDKYRNGQIKVDELRWKRMALALLDFKIGDDGLAHKMGNAFLELLPTKTLLFPDTVYILQYLRAKAYQLHLITNGFEKTQHAKMKSSGINGFFQEVITSEGSNSLKPHPEIFAYALLKTGAAKRESIMIGDTPEVDILGALNAGMDQVYVNHTQNPEPVKATYTVTSLKELENIF